MIQFIQLQQDIGHQHIYIHQVIVDIGCHDIMIITIHHPIIIPLHYIAIISIQDHPTIHHITGEIMMPIHIYTIAHISQDIHQLEAVHIIMIIFIEDLAHI